MNSQKSILFVQHAHLLGGSVVSLREVVIDALSNGYICAVACPNNTIAKIYSKIGAQTFVFDIVPLNHNTAFHFKITFFNLLRVIRIFLRTAVSLVELNKVLRKFRPGIVHLNSSTLILYSIYCRLAGLPNLFHVRESIVHGHFGIRKRLIKSIVNSCATYIIYISEHEFEVLNTHPRKSLVIYNYIHLSVFQTNDSRQVPRGSKFQVIILGGLFRLKGGNVILRALLHVPDDVELHILGAHDPRYEGAEEILKVDGESYLKEILELLEYPEISPRVKFLGRVPDPAVHIASANVVVFWAALPHFPRPVFEAWLLKKPVIYYNPDFYSSIINGENVFFIKDESPSSLEEAIEAVRNGRLNSKEELETSFNLARKFFTEKNFEQINRLYQSCLSQK